MPCHGTCGDSDNCPVKNWCVCQWAFARYVKLSGGCSKIQTVICEAINIETLHAYRNNTGYKEALDCLQEKCGSLVLYS